MTSTGTEIIFEVREAEEGGFWARALGVNIITEADTWDELVEMVRDAIKCHFDDESERPKVLRLLLMKEQAVLV
jgi:predicted RNase H-like HicB family nuclease